MHRAAVAFLVAALVSLIFGNRIVRLLERLRFRQTVSEDVPETHRTKQGTPTMGGIIIILGTGVGTACVWSGDAKALAVIFLALTFCALGAVDDFIIASKGRALGLKARHKLAVQFLIAIVFVFWVSKLRASFPTVLAIGNCSAVDLGLAYYVFAVLFVVGMSNAVNLTDGLDGLAAGLVTISAIPLGILVIGAMGANSALAILSWAIAGGCLGFLWYNVWPAKIFMGDTGSLGLGAGLAGIAIASRREIVMLVLGAIFVAEAFSVIAQVISFKSTGHRIFRMTPIHHHFELLGWPEQRIVVRFWIIQVLISILTMVCLGVFRLWS